MRILYIFIAFLIFASCGRQSEKVVETSVKPSIEDIVLRREEESLATGIRHDTLFEGFYLGMEEDEALKILDNSKHIFKKRIDNSYKYYTTIHTTNRSYLFQYSYPELTIKDGAIGIFTDEVYLPEDYYDIVKLYADKYGDSFEDTSRILRSDFDIVNYFFKDNIEIMVCFGNKSITIIYYDIPIKMEMDRIRRENRENSTEETKSRI